MFEGILKKYYQKKYPNRIIEILKIGKYVTVTFADTLGNANYLLKDSFSYNRVEILNKITGFSARYGFCPQIGPVAIIGIPDSQKIINYFCDVAEYGKFKPNFEFEFHNYTEEEAKQIGNYNVYGFKGFENISKIAKLEKICFFEDERFKIKFSDEYRIFNMDAKFIGKWSYAVIKDLLKEDDFVAQGNIVRFAVVGGNKHVAILGLFASQMELAAGFRDVWEYGENEPEIQTIKFLDEDEAKIYRDYTLYFYEAVFPSEFIKEYPRIILDRTIDSRFNFFDTPNKKDLRLTELKELYRTKEV